MNLPLSDRMAALDAVEAIRTGVPLSMPPGAPVVPSAELIKTAALDAGLFLREGEAEQALALMQQTSAPSGSVEPLRAAVSRRATKAQRLLLSVGGIMLLLPTLMWGAKFMRPEPAQASLPIVTSIVPTADMLRDSKAVEFARTSITNLSTFDEAHLPEQITKAAEPFAPEEREAVKSQLNERLAQEAWPSHSRMTVTVQDVLSERHPDNRTWTVYSRIQRHLEPGNGRQSVTINEQVTAQVEETLSGWRLKEYRQYLGKMPGS